MRAHVISRELIQEKAIDSLTYQEMLTKLSEDLTLAEMELCGMPEPK
jgi:hypothetical protein